MGVNHGGNARIGGPYERQALLDGPKTGLSQVLIRATGEAEPSIIGDVQQPRRSRRRLCFA